MLSGIRVGKKKGKKRKLQDEQQQQQQQQQQEEETGSDDAANGADSARQTVDANQAAADALRARLLGGGSLGDGKTADQSRAAAAAPAPPASLGNEDVISRLEKRGKITSDTKQSPNGGDGGDDAVVLTNEAAATLQREQYRREDFRHGARKGKISQKDVTAVATTASRDMTIADMVAEEKRESATNMDETYARNVARIGSRYKGSDFDQGKQPGASMGADEVDYSGIEGGADMSMFQDPSSRLTDAARAQRERARQVTQHDRQSAITNKCWWWMEAASFQRHRLLALGNHVYLMLCPSNLALTELSCYLVPIQHAESFRACEDEVWDEVQRFRTSLRRMFAKTGQGVLFCETVLPSKNLWQARMEVVPVPRRVEQDAAMYFKSALTEQAEEWGTHTKLLTTKEKGLRRTIPKGFSYFNCEFEGGGFAQIIETNAFPKDFALDTIAGMMQLDPVRFKRKQRPQDGDKAVVLSFAKRWKEFDWTLELD
mmetsp:Transcript_21438/g.50584  ORF Transcript_21438/g.50584 Transcript_21438/m.50584 type:complete len:487 (+) Transcript_21438:128-1588(+)